MNIEIEAPQIWLKAPFLEGDTVSEYFPDKDSKSGKRKVNSIKLKTPFVIETPMKSIHIEDVCVVMQHGQYLIEFMEEEDGDVIMSCSMSRELLNILNFTMNQFDEVNPNE